MIYYTEQRKAADDMVQDDSKAIGFAINPGPVITKTKIFSWKYDEFKNCRLVLCRVLGSAMWLRYPKHLISLTNGKTI